MSINNKLQAVKETVPSLVTLVAVSKTKPPELIAEAYEAGHRDFGENKVQELVPKYETLPKDIRWHMIGHLQTNKVKYIVPFVHLIHGVDRFKLLTEINKRAQNIDRVVNCLLQIHIAEEESKFGFSGEELMTLLGEEQIQQLAHVKIMGLMGMATNTDNESIVKMEFKRLRNLFDQLKIEFYSDSEDFSILSMGMSNDYLQAIQEGSNMVRVGSAIFGARN